MNHLVDIVRMYDRIVRVVSVIVWRPLETKESDGK